MNGNGTKTADYLIIGAGIMGASIAFHLAQRKAGKVALIEKDRAAQGASGRSSGLVRMHYCFPPEVQLAVKSLEFFENWKQLVGEPGEFRKTGFVRLVPAQELPLLKANVAMQKRLGAKTEVIGLTELKELEPDWNLDDNPAAAYEPDGGYGDGAVATQDLLASARSQGVDYHPKTRATGFVRDGDRVIGVRTDQGEIHAGAVVVATGQWTQLLFRTIGIDLPIETEFHQVAILRNPPGLQTKGSACIDSNLALYFRPDGLDKTLVGDFFGDKSVDPENFPQRPRDAWIEEVIEKACKRIPKLESAEVLRGVTGIYDLTPDGRPLLGELSGTPGLYVVAGFSGMGFKIAPAIGLVMTEVLLDGRARTVDITAFRPSRFAEGKPIKAEFEYQFE
jgi:sarcosine oxidase subunit beta